MPGLGGMEPEARTGSCLLPQQACIQYGFAGGAAAWLLMALSQHRDRFPCLIHIEYASMYLEFYSYIKGAISQKVNQWKGID